MPVTSRDATFFMNIFDPNLSEWAHYSPADMADDVVSVTTRGPHVVVFRLIHSCNPSWFEDDQLAEITPMLQQSSA
jgi:hypothetical protein